MGRLSLHGKCFRCIVLAGTLLLLTGFSAVLWAEEIHQDRSAAEAPLDLRRILEHAKQQVFPALVFVKPIVEDYESGEKRNRQVFGSGVVISQDGLVITNNHVVEKAVKVHCVLSDKDQVSAQIVGRDPDTDLALLKLDVPPSKLPLPYGTFADSNRLTEGDFVMALGSPFGFMRSISLGIISNTRRYLGFDTQYKYNTFLQTDAAVNPGNSGGPLVDTEGKIVGINTLGIAWGEGVGFSIPSNLVKEIAAKLGQDKEVRRAWSGISLQPLKDFYTNTFTDAQAGVLVSDVELGSPADRADIKKGDILVAVSDQQLNGTYAEDLPVVASVIASLPVNTPLKATLVRGGQETVCMLTLVLKGKVEGETFDCRRWNMTVKEISKHEDAELYFYQKEGVFVCGVRHPGNAAAAGLNRGDIIASIDKKEVKSLEELEKVYDEISSDTTRARRVLIEVLRGGYRKWFTLDYTTDYQKEN